MTQYSGQGRERLVTATAATSDANGAITFRVGPCPLGFVWQGSVTITNAPSGALFTSSVASTPWGQHAGSTNFGPVQLWGNETLVVTGVGLQKLTQYSMLFFGVAMPEEMAEPLPPVAPLSTVAVETSTKLVNGAVLSGSGFVDITVPSLTRRLTVVVFSALVLDTDITLIGLTSNADYGSGVFNGVDGPTVFYFAIEPTIDQVYRLSFNRAVTYWVTANTTSPLVVTGAVSPLVIAQPIQVSGPLGGPVNTSGGPTGPFNLYALGSAAVSNNNVVIAAPGAGNSIYVQSLHIDNGGLAAGAGAFADFHPAGLGRFATLSIIGPAPNTDKFIAYPGGFEMPANTALQVDVIANGFSWIATYAIGPTI